MKIFTILVITVILMVVMFHCIRDNEDIDDDITGSMHL